MKAVILDNIRSAHNVGSIFRTSDGAGVSKIYLCGYTPTPVDRFGRVQPEIAKTSLSATESVPWEYCESVSELTRRLQADHVTVAAIEQTDKSIGYQSWQPTESVAYVFGNEIDGVDTDVCAQADVVLEIPMQGQKESLNVSVTAGIILFNA